MGYENYTVKQFEDAMFKNDRSVMDEDTYKEVYTEYVDTAKLYEEEEFNKVSRIHYLNNRINTISIALRLHREFLENFDLPFNDFDVFKKNGHSVRWNGDKELFLNSLLRVEFSEKKYISECENAIKDLIEFRKKKNNPEEIPIKIKRESWIRTINSLGKIGYKIDKLVTTVEDLSLMVKQEREK